MSGKKVKGERGKLNFYHTKEASFDSEEISSKVLNAEQSNTSLIFNNEYFLKLYRKLDNTINPDLEITRYLSEKTTYENAPIFLGAIEYTPDPRTNIVLGMMENLVPNQGDAWDYTKDALKIFFENVLSRSQDVEPSLIQPDFSVPLEYQGVPRDLRELMGVVFPERMELLGIRTAEMHLALAAHPEEKDFEHEPFSLHYQRSLFSSLQSLTRNAFQNLESNLASLPKELREEAKEVLGMKADVLRLFKRVFHHKIPIMKIRNHGDYHLGQVLWTGKDFIIIDFEGEPARAFSERRLKRSSLRDVAGMIRSFHYATYSTLMEAEFEPNRNEGDLEQYAEAWYYHVTRIFLKSYYERVGENNFIPSDKEDFKILLETFLLEKAIYELNYELNNRPLWVLIPLRGIQTIIRRYKDG